MPSKLIRLKTRYNKNKFISKRLGKEMEELIKLINYNIKNKQFFQYDYNVELLKELNKKLELVWDTQIMLLTIIENEKN